jgi:hypothetical protein
VRESIWWRSTSRAADGRTVLMTVTHPLDPASIMATAANLEKMGINPGCKSR